MGTQSELVVHDTAITDEEEAAKALLTLDNLPDMPIDTEDVDHQTDITS